MHRRRFAILLDAGFLKRKLRADGPVTARHVYALSQAIERHGALAGGLLYRVYYYDAAPLARAVAHPLTGTLIEYSKTAAFLNGNALARDVAQLPHYALRQGECSHEGWMVRVRALKAGRHDPASDSFALENSDLEPVIRQKGVDMRIGMDIAALTLKRQVDVIVLVTADSDFVPAIKFARREGAQLYLFTLGHGVREGIAEHVDLLVASTASALIDAPAPPS